MARVNPKRRSHRRDRCDHEWIIENRMTDQGRSPAHPAGASPPEYRRLKVCKKCSATRHASN